MNKLWILIFLSIVPIQIGIPLSAPGIDLQTQILDQMAFPPRITRLTTMGSHLFG